MTVYAVKKCYIHDEIEYIEYQILPYNLQGTIKVYLKYFQHGWFWLLKFLWTCRFTEKGAMKLKKKLESKTIYRGQ